MNYYERHLGDYAKDTGHLSMLEHGAYTLLLDRYYSTEQGIPADQAHRVARAKTKEERAAVDAVLGEFFTLADGVWTKGRVQQEIAKAAGRIAAAQNNGRRGGRPKKEPEQNQETTQQKPSGLLLGSENGTQTKALHTPDTREREKTPPTPKGVDEPAGFARFWATWPTNDRKGGRAKCLELWRRARLETDAERIVAHVEAMKATAKWRESGGEFVPMPATYLNGRRWDGAELEANGHDSLMAGAV